MTDRDKRDMELALKAMNAFANRDARSLRTTAIECLMLAAEIEKEKGGQWPYCGQANDDDAIAEYRRG